MTKTPKEKFTSTFRIKSAKTGKWAAKGYFWRNHGSHTWSTRAALSGHLSYFMQGDFTENRLIKYSREDVVFETVFNEDGRVVAEEEYPLGTLLDQMRLRSIKRTISERRSDLRRAKKNSPTSNYIQILQDNIAALEALLSK